MLETNLSLHTLAVDNVETGNDIFKYHRCLLAGIWADEDTVANKTIIVVAMPGANTAVVVAVGEWGCSCVHARSYCRSEDNSGGGRGGGEGGEVAGVRESF